ncbi:MAG: DUF2330 domain-containing protein [Deltaproteobacteria bacterium]|nr:DUF2330 domain-containing protein [Deltaproteobacteria bacterium]
MRRSNVLCVMLTAASLIALETPAALACGGFFSSSESEIVDMSDQRALLVSFEGRVDQFVQIAYEGVPAQFAWVYPFPAQPTLEQVSSDLFTLLDEGTRPRFTIIDESGGGGGGAGDASGNTGCSCGDIIGVGGNGGDDMTGDMDAGADGGSSVDVWDEGEVGVFDYAVITATSIDDMLTWLGDNGFVVPETAKPVLQHYVDLSWFFVAMKLSPGTGFGNAATSTIKFSYLSETMTYPLYMSSISAASHLGILLYVLAPHRMDAAGAYVTSEIATNELDAITPETTNYEDLFAKAIDVNGGRAFAVEYAGSGGEVEDMLWSVEDISSAAKAQYLTRLRTIMSPNVMDADVPLEPAASDTVIDPTFEIFYSRTTNAAVGGWALLAGLFSYTLLRGAARRLRGRKGEVP